MRQWMLECLRDRDWRCRMGSILAVALLIVVVIYGRIVLSSSPAPVRLVVYAFSTQQEVLSQSIFPAFEEAWEKEAGRDLIIEGVFGPSGTLAGQINLGAPADVALFSHTQHVTHLKVGRRVSVGSDPVVIGYSPMVIVTRPGNPAGIAEFSDLARPGLRLLHADPRASGAGQWAVLAEYGSALQSDAGQALQSDAGQALQSDAGQSAVGLRTGPDATAGHLAQCAPVGCLGPGDDDVVRTGRR